MVSAQLVLLGAVALPLIVEAHDGSLVDFLRPPHWRVVEHGLPLRWLAAISRPAEREHSDSGNLWANVDVTYMRRQEVPPETYRQVVGDDVRRKRVYCGCLLPMTNIVESIRLVKSIQGLPSEPLCHCL